MCEYKILPVNLSSSAIDRMSTASPFVQYRSITRASLLTSSMRSLLRVTITEFKMVNLKCS